MGVYTGAITLQAAVEEDVELGGVVEDDLWGKEMFLVSKILLTARRNLSVRSLDKVELIETWRSLQISLNRDRIVNINGAANPVGS